VKRVLVLVLLAITLVGTVASAKQKDIGIASNGS